MKAVHHARMCSSFLALTLVVAAGCSSDDKVGDTSDAATTEVAGTDTSVTAGTDVATTTATDAATTTATDAATTATDAATTATDAATTATDAATTATDAATTATDAATDASDTTAGPACDDKGDCTWCAYATAPASTADCYCTICPDTITTPAQCEANALAWATHCEGDKWASTANCPVPRCTLPDPLACLGGECTSGCAQTDCPALACPVEEQLVVPGECCPRCTGPSACEGTDDCGLCLYDRPVAAPADCYCLLCPVPVESATCVGNEKQWKQHCDPWPAGPCPVPSCLGGSPPECVQGECEAPLDGCFFQDDCTSCAGTVATHAGECACPTCPRPHSKAYCDAVEAQRTGVCDGFDFESCPAVPCVELPAPTCLSGGVCGSDER